jgi:hypothetical protein
MQVAFFEASPSTIDADMTDSDVAAGAGQQKACDVYHCGGGRRGSGAGGDGLV